MRLVMNISLLSTKYKVRKIEEQDISIVYNLCIKNTLYYKFCPPMVTEQSIRDDMLALPKGKCHEDKLYIGFYDNGKLILVMDLILEYPNKETAYIGFFMMNVETQSKGSGTNIIFEVCVALKQAGFLYVTLGYVKGNPQCEAFWLKNKFTQTGVETKSDSYTIVVMERVL
jgi:RimJ/RimL family protein N-acetyltransferase